MSLEDSVWPRQYVFAHSLHGGPGTILSEDDTPGSDAAAAYWRMHAQLCAPGSEAAVLDRLNFLLAARHDEVARGGCLSVASDSPR